MMQENSNKKNNNKKPNILQDQCVYFDLMDIPVSGFHFWIGISGVELSGVVT